MKIPVDFCRGPAGAFLAINDLVVAGDCTGGGRVIQGFEVEGEDLLRALNSKSADRMAEANAKGGG